VCAFILSFFTVHLSYIPSAWPFTLLSNLIIYANTETNYSSLLVFRSETGLWYHHDVLVSHTYFLNHLAKFNKICYKKYDIIDHIKVKIYGFLKSVLPTTRMRELVKRKATNLTRVLISPQPDPTEETIERSSFFVVRVHCCRGDLVRRTTFWIFFFEWFAKFRVWSL
jgi:hypothetical protein